MLRILQDETRLNNRNLCGIDESFCYPIRRPLDVVAYYKLPYNGAWELSQVSIYDQTFSDLYVLMNSTILQQYFAIVVSTDSNGDDFIVIRQKQPIYNYDGVQPEKTCYAIEFTLTGDTSTVKLYSEPVCYAERYCMNQYTIAWGIAGVDELTFTTICDGVTYSFDYLNVPPGMWIEYTGPFTDIFLPDGCELTGVTANDEPIEFTLIEQCFGANNCQSYVRIEGNGKFLYDCQGRYFGVVTEVQETSSSTQVIFVDATDDKRLMLDLLSMNVQNGKVRQIEGVNKPIRVKGSCYISHSEVLERYKIYSTCAVPPWFQREVNNVASMQQVVLTGTSPLLDDYDNYIELMQSEEYNWKPRQYGNYSFPNLIFETCSCHRNFTC